MKIRWTNWILNLLPMAMRHTGLFAFARVMVSHVMRLDGEYREFERDARMRVSITPQREVLEEVIRVKTGVDVVLDEGNGRPVDFVVKCDFKDVDTERFLFSFLDKYKQAGKTYAYENVAIVNSAAWTGYRCELASVGEQWTAFVCEKMGKRDNYIHIVTEGGYVSLEADYAVTSMVLVSGVSVGMDQNGKPIIRPLSFVIDVGDRVSNAIRPVGEVLYDRFTIDVTEDENYLYILEWER